MTHEVPTSTGALARLGFSRTERVQRFLGEPALASLPREDIQALGAVPDGDDAVLGLLRVAEAARDAGLTTLLERFLTTVGHTSPRERETGQLSPGDGLIALLGTSVAAGDMLARHPEALELLLVEDPLALDAAAVREHLLRAVGADPAADMPVASGSGRDSRDALRVAYHERLAQIALADVSAPHPAQIQPDISAALSDLADAALDAAIAISRCAVAGHDTVRWAVLAMGKTGARELNYISDVDVLHVIEPAGDDTDEESLVRIGSALARELARVCSDRTAAGTLWQVDANLRPEGKDGPLVRTLDSYRRYYERWAESWEFQALLKARAAAGDRELGEAFEQLVAPWVWQASTRDGFVEDTRAMRRRVVAHIPRGEVDRHVKLGPGGLRDVEFTVQLLQMVHGRTDEALRSRTTLVALHQLGDGGYISRDQVSELDAAYRFLRCLEHRLQLHRLRRTQVLPTGKDDLRRLSRSLRLSPEEFIRTYERTRRRVRQLHEEIFYRPLLVTASQLSDGQVRLRPEEARDRLAAIGYRDPGRALSHIQALTEGLSRRAAIQRQLLPVLLEWLADGIDPDLGLLAFRRLSDALGSAHWYLALLRDSGVAARRLVRVLAGSRFVGGQLEQIPEAVRWLGRDESLRPLRRDALGREFLAVIDRAQDINEAKDVIRRTRRRELLRIALAHLCELLTPVEVAHALTDLAEAVLEAGLLVAYHAVALDQGRIDDEATVLADAVLDDGGQVDDSTATQLRERRSDPARALGIELAVIALGSFGAREMGYSSDADVQFVAVDRGAGRSTEKLGIAVATSIQQILNAPAAGADMRVSADLRPQGKQGLLARHEDAWTAYYRRDALTWEKQALLRGRVIIASRQTAERLRDTMDQVRYPSGGLAASDRRDIVRMKARIEAERLPRGADPARHVKLGRGGMTDVEWCAQLLTLEHGHHHPQLRTPGTLDVLQAAVDAGVLPADQARDLREAWILGWRIRRGLFLWKGREAQVLPSDRVDLRALAWLLDGPDATAADLEDTYLRVTRHARLITEQLVFGRLVQ